MKRLGLRPNLIHLNSLMFGYFVGREQARFMQRLPEGESLSDEHLEDVGGLIDFWRRAGSTYFEHEGNLPDQLGYSVPVLTPPEARDLASRLSPSTIEGRALVRRSVAATELYTFLLNGEMRIGIFHHGPYELGDGEQLVIKELVGLRDRFLSWDIDEPPAVDSYLRVMRLRGVKSKIDLFGSFTPDPADYSEHIVAEGLFTPDAGGGLRELSSAEMAEINTAASNSQLKMFTQAMAWSPEQRVAYGADLYASIALNLTRCAGLAIDQSVRDEFRVTAAPVVARIMSGEEDLRALQRISADGAAPLSLALGAAPSRLEQ